MYRSIINRTSRIERLAHLIDDIMGEAQNEVKNTPADDFDRAIRLHALDDLDRLVVALEKIAEK